MALEPIKRLAINRSLAKLPERGRALISRIPEPVQLQLRHYSRRTFVITFEILIGILVVGLVAGALLNSRLNEGPVSLSFLSGPIEAAINRELAGLAVKIDDVILRKPDNGTGLQFRLSNIELMDERGDVVAQAPLAAVGLSGRSLLSGRLSPGSVDLIGARMILFFSPDSGLALSFSRPDSADQDGGSNLKITQSKEAAETIVEMRQPGADNEVEAGRQIDLVALIYDSFEETRQEGGAASHLARFGFQDAVVVFDHAGEQTLWRVPDFSLNLIHKQKRSIISGTATINTGDENWNFRFRTEQSEKRKNLTFTMLFDDLVPKEFSNLFPDAAALAAFDLPLRGEASVNFTRSGEVIDAGAKLQLAAGHIITPWEKDTPLLIDEGLINLRYQREGNRIELLPSTFLWGESRATLSGVAQANPQSEGEAKSWSYAFQANDAVLAAEDFGAVPVGVEEWSVRGSILAGGEKIKIDEYRLQLVDGGMEFSGVVTNAPGSPEVLGRGRLRAGSAETFKRLWSPLLAPLSRLWVGEHLITASNVVGEFSIAMPGGMMAKAQDLSGEIPDEAFSMQMEVKDLSFRFIDTMPPVRTDSATMSIVGRRLVFDLAQSSIPLPSGGVLNVAGGQFKIDDLRPRDPIGEAKFRVTGQLKPTLELLDYEPFEILKKNSLRADQYGGDASINFALKMLLKKGVTLSDIGVQGKARIENITGKGMFGKIAIEGGRVDFGVTEKAIDARGNILLNGVPVAVTWQRIFGAKAGKQPAIRISGVFDDSARKQLGMQTDHVLRGEVPTVFLISRGENDRPVLRVEADLGNANLVLANIGWQKAPGRAANMGFDVVETDEGFTDLQNFQINGDDIAIHGWLRMDKKGDLVAYHFPNVSFNRITRLEVAGQRDKNGFWTVKAKSPSYDGRQLFRSLFSGGRISESQPTQKSFSKGMDLEAEFGTMIGHFDARIKNLKVRMRKRNGRLTKFTADGVFPNGKQLTVLLDEKKGEPRILTAKTEDAGAAFRLVGFYPKIEGGNSVLSVNMDARGAASTTGTLEVRNFAIIGEQISGGVVASASSSKRRQQAQTSYQKIDFDKMSVPFSVGFGQFVLHNSQINGPLIGATMRGRIDFQKQRIDVGGTYVPLFGLNTIPGEIPILGDILVGRRGEGLLGVTFAVQGSIANPEVLVNPVSMVAPGIFRQIFEMSPNAPQIQRREIPKAQ